MMIEPEPTPGKEREHAQRSGRAAGRDQDPLDEAGALVHDILARIHPPGSFQVDLIRDGELTIALATDRPEFLAERRQVAEDFGTIEQFIGLAEKRPEPGSVHTLQVGGRTVPLHIDDPAQLLDIAEQGIGVAIAAYTLTDGEQRQVADFQKRVNNLRDG